MNKRTQMCERGKMKGKSEWLEWMSGREGRGSEITSERVGGKKMQVRPSCMSSYPFIALLFFSNLGSVYFHPSSIFTRMEGQEG